MRKLFIGGIVAVIVLASWPAGTTRRTRRPSRHAMQSDYWQIDQIEKNFHRPRRSRTSI